MHRLYITYWYYSILETVSLVTLERRANPHRTLDAGNINLDGMNA
jgi:hypothetical protein